MILAVIIVVLVVAHLNKLVMLLLFGVAFACHVLAWVTEVVHRQVWHRRLARYVPGFTPPLRPKSALILFVMSLATVSALIAWQVMTAKTNPTPGEWMKTLSSLSPDVGDLPVGYSMREKRVETVIEPHPTLVLTFTGPAQDNEIRFTAFDSQDEALQFFSTIETVREAEPEWAAEHTSEQMVGPSKVICLDREDGGVGCFMVAADGVLIESRSSEIRAVRPTTAENAVTLLEAAIEHWLVGAEELKY